MVNEGRCLDRKRVAYIKMRNVFKHLPVCLKERNYMEELYVIWKVLLKLDS
jgi:hypothetical protein